MLLCANSDIVRQTLTTLQQRIQGRVNRINTSLLGLLGAPTACRRHHRPSKTPKVYRGTTDVSGILLICQGHNLHDRGTTELSGHNQGTIGLIGATPISQGLLRPLRSTTDQSGTQSTYQRHHRLIGKIPPICQMRHRPITGTTALLGAPPPY